VDTDKKKILNFFPKMQLKILSEIIIGLSIMPLNIYEEVKQKVQNISDSHCPL